MIEPSNSSFFSRWRNTLVLFDLPGARGVLERDVDAGADPVEDLRALQAGDPDLHGLLKEESLPHFGDVVLARLRLARLLVPLLGLVEGGLQDVDDVAV